MQSSLFSKIMASDRLTQLQDAVNFQAENFCNSIGILQQVASGSSFPEFEKTTQNGSSSPADGTTTNGPTTVNSTNTATSSNNNKENVLSSVKSSSHTLNGTTSNSTNTSTKPQSVDSNSTDDLVNNKKKTDATGPNAPMSMEDYGQMFARTIARTAKDIDTLIDSLPLTNESGESMSSSGSSASSVSSGGLSAEQFTSSIRKLEMENIETAAQLEETIKRGEIMLERIQSALAEIAQLQLKSQSLNES